MAKINRKNEKNKTFGGIIHVRELFSRYVVFVIYEMMEVRCISFG